MNEEGKQVDRAEDEDDAYFASLFSALRNVLPAVNADLAERIMGRVTTLQDRERLLAPALDSVAGQLVVQALNLFSSWFGSGDAARDQDLGERLGDQRSEQDGEG